MKTSVDIPDELLRMAKARAALEGTTLRDVIIQALYEKLHAPPAKTQRRHTEFPIIHSRRTDPLLTPEQVKKEDEAISAQEAL